MAWKVTTMLQTGNKGFTLFEAVLTTAIFAVGTLFVYEGFFVCLDSFNYCSNHLDAIGWMDEKIWQTQNELNHFGPKSRIETNGEFAERSKAFRWRLSPKLIDSEGGLYKINLSLNWQEGRRTIRLKRIAYARYEEE